MFPAPSTARLGMKRLLESGFQVEAWSASPIVPPVTGIWYQRTAAWVLELPSTVCASHSDSTVPMREYWFCIIARGPSVSSELPSFSATVEGGLDHVVAVIESVGPVKVELAVFAQSMWNFQMRTRFVHPQMDAK